MLSREMGLPFEMADMDHISMASYRAKLHGSECLAH